MMPKRTSYTIHMPADLDLPDDTVRALVVAEAGPFPGRNRGVSEISAGIVVEWEVVEWR